MRLSSLVGLLFGLGGIAAAVSTTGSRLLVILDEETERAKYSQFWSDLEGRGFQITYRAPRDESLSLFQHGEPAYSHLLILPTKSKGLGPSLTPILLADFVNQGSNVLLALSSEQAVPSSLSNLLLEFDITLAPDRNSLVVDHFNYDKKSASEKHDVLLLPSPTFSKPEIRNFFAVDGTVAFPRPVGQILGHASPLLSSVVKAPDTSYIYSPKDESESAEDPFATGSQISIVSAFQAHNSARLSVLGSAEALEDKWFTASVQASGPGKKVGKTSNRAFAEKLSAWTFKELGVLKVGTIQHYLNEGAQKGANNGTTALASVDLNPSLYRIKNDVHYSIALSEWSTDRWIPFQPPVGDAVQLEVSMLSPFHRLTLESKAKTSDAAVYSADFKLPDQHGIFNLFVEYRRPFYTNVEEKTTVTVRHFAHDEWPRSYSISGAYPWISGIWVTVVGWLAFVVLWLYSSPKNTAQKSASKKR